MGTKQLMLTCPRRVESAGVAYAFVVVLPHRGVGNRTFGNI